MKDYQAALAARVESQVLACIGCNDCLLACPVAESRLVTIAELNHAVHLPVISQPNVVQFLSACTQCKQCVPACPADLDRSEMVLFNKLKVEDAVPNHELLLQSTRNAWPSGWSLDGVAQTLAGLELFRDVDAASLRRMIQKSTLRLLGASEELAREGDFYERLAVVLTGSLVQTSGGPRGELLYLVVLGPGSFFGEVGVLGDCPEPYGAVAREESVVLEVPKLAVLKLMEQSASFGETMDLLYARHALHTHARNSRALGVLSEAAIAELLVEARLELVPAGHTLFSQADRPRDFFLVRAGFLRALKGDASGERVLTYFREGDLFGLTSLLRQEAQQGYSAQAVGRTEVVRFRGSNLGALFGRHPEVYASLSQAAFEAESLALSNDVGMSPFMAGAYGMPTTPPERPSHGSRHSGSSAGSGVARSPSRSSSPARPSHAPSFSDERAKLEAGVLVEEGIAKGREVLVIDQNLCTGCNNCVDACGRRHGTSRLQLRGLEVEHYMFPAACRHCADPACLLCSVNGIVRLPSGEIQIVEDNCIGCGACAERCPYGNISMHAVTRKKRGFWPGMLAFLARGSSEEDTLEALDPKVERVAVKCDLCAGYGDYACVTACPVGANFRVDPSRLVTK